MIVVLILSLEQLFVKLMHKVYEICAIFEICNLKYCRFGVTVTTDDIVVTGYGTVAAPDVVNCLVCNYPNGAKFIHN